MKHFKEKHNLTTVVSLQNLQQAEHITEKQYSKLNCYVAKNDKYTIANVHKYISKNLYRKLKSLQRDYNLVLN